MEWNGSTGVGAVRGNSWPFMCVSVFIHWLYCGPDKAGYRALSAALGQWVCAWSKKVFYGGYTQSTFWIGSGYPGNNEWKGTNEHVEESLSGSAHDQSTASDTEENATRGE